MAVETKKKEIIEKLRNGVIQYDETACSAIMTCIVMIDG